MKTGLRKNYEFVLKDDFRSSEIICQDVLSEIGDFGTNSSPGIVAEFRILFLLYRGLQEYFAI